MEIKWNGWIISVRPWTQETKRKNDEGFRFLSIDEIESFFLLPSRLSESSGVIIVETGSPQEDNEEVGRWDFLIKRSKIGRPIRWITRQSSSPAFFLYWGWALYFCSRSQILIWLFANLYSCCIAMNEIICLVMVMLSIVQLLGSRNTRIIVTGDCQPFD